MKKYDIESVLNAQRAFFDEGGTLAVPSRREYLRLLYREISQNEHEIHAGLRADLGKCAGEAYMCETGLVLSELRFMIRHINGFARPRRVSRSMSQPFARPYILPSPYGATLVMSPWNYPFLLSMTPLIDAVAAGNTVILKTSSYSPNTSAVVKTILEAVFPPEYVFVVTGGREENDALTKLKFDYIFFTGSKNVGGLVYERAAANMTPVTLELGGKCPCIVDETADLPLAARRIVWGKFLNLGQTCVAPDYILCPISIRDKLVDELRREITRQFGAEPLSNPTYGKMINEKHFTRVCGLIDPDRVVVGGECRADTRSIEPTVMIDITPDDAVMKEEIFGPVLPILTYADGDDDSVAAFIKGGDEPLALYVFSTDKRRVKRFTTELSFGGGCVNDAVLHLATPRLPFGGVGASGIGAYHGRAGFDTFTHYKGMIRSGGLDIPLRYQPYGRFHDAITRLFLR